MSTEAQVSFSGNATQLLTEYQKLEAARKKELEQLRGVKEAHNAAAQAEIAAGRDAAKIKEANLTAQEKANRSIQRAQELLKSGKLTQAEFNAELSRQNQLLDSGGSKLAGFGKEALVAFTGVGSAIAAVMTAASALKGEYEELRRRQAEAGASQLSFGDSIRAMSQNFSADATVGLDQLEPRLLEIVKRTGAKPEGVAQAASAALSAKGALSNDAALSAVEQAFRVNPADAGGATELASRALDLMGASGTTDPRAAIGALVQTGGAARITDLSKLGRTVTPAVAAMMSRGDTMEQALETFTTMTLLASDSEGSTSSTGTINLANRLAGFVPTADAKDKRGKFNVSPAAIAAFESSRSTTERIQAMRQNADLRRAFFATNSFDAQMQAPAEMLLSGDEQALAKEAAVRASIGGIETGAAAFEQKVADMRLLPSQRNVELKQRAEANVKLAELRDTAAGDADLATTTFENTLGKVDLPGYDSFTRGTYMASLASRSAVSGDTATEGANLLGRLALSGDVSAPEAKLLMEQVAVLREIAASNRTMAQNSAGPPPEAALSR